MMQTTTIEAGPRRGNNEDEDYEQYLVRLRSRFDKNTANVPVFTTDSGDLWQLYLDSFPADERQYHNCNACRSFINRYGGLVTLEDGEQRSAVWSVNDAPRLYERAALALSRTVERGRVTGVFLSSESTLGHPVTGCWKHLSVTNRAPFKEALLNASQAAAAKAEDYRTVARAIGEFRIQTIETAVQLLKTDALYRTEKVLGAAEWLLERSLEAQEKNRATKERKLWRAIATAPAGFCHPRSSMIGTLLEDLEAGLPFEDVKAKFAAKMHPLKYQRPQAAPSQETIDQAEKAFERLGLAASLRRRYARLDEVEALWKPAATSQTKTDGIFGHLRGKQPSDPLDVNQAQPITWDKFSRTILPTATKIEALVPAHGDFVALVTAEDPEAPPILQWDRPERRNPVSWYLYHNGSPASLWGLAGGQWREVTAISENPAKWGNAAMVHHGNSAVLVLDGCRDSRHAHVGAALFPETVRGDLHGVRSVIEAYSRTARLSGYEQASACGLLIGKQTSVTVRVVSGKLRTTYRIDRWD